MSARRKLRHGQMVSVFLRSSKKVFVRHKTICFFCHDPIPANTYCRYWSGYGSRVLVNQTKVGGYFHKACHKRMMKDSFLFECYILNGQLSPEMLEDEIRRTITVDSLLAEWEMVEHPSGCLVIVGRKGGKRFSGTNECRPRKKVGGVNKTIASLVYQLGGGEKEPDDVIRHTCDVSTCVEFDHLVAGSRSDNVREGFTRGRHDKRYKGLTPCQKVKLTLSDRLERIARYGDPDWFEGWENGRDEWLAQQ